MLLQHYLGNLDNTRDHRGSLGAIVDVKTHVLILIRVKGVGRSGNLIFLNLSICTGASWVRAVKSSLKTWEDILKWITFGSI